MNVTSMTVLGGDLRQCYLAEYMYTLGHDVICYGTVPFPFSQADKIPVSDNLMKALSHARLILGPVPFSKDGVHINQSGPSALSLSDLQSRLRPGQLLIGGSFPSSFADSLSESQISLLDVMREEDFLQKNAALTAEGLLATLIAETPFSLRGRKLLLLGYGRCGTEICRILAPFSMEITVCDHNEAALLRAGRSQFAAKKPWELTDDAMDFDLIVNTVPAKVLTDVQLNGLHRRCILFDIASTPFGFDEKLLAQKKCRLVRCPGIPGRILPQAAGELLGRTISERMQSYG